MGYHFLDSKGHKVVRSKDVTFNKDFLYGSKAATNSSNLMKPNQKDQVVLEDSLENLENKSIVAKHRLSSKITQSPYGSSYTSEGSKNSGSFKNSERSDKEDSKDEAFYEEGVFETPQKRRVDYNEIFSPVVKMTIIRLVFSNVAVEDLHLEQLDVKTAFLHGDLDKDIYMYNQRVFNKLGKKKTSCARYKRCDMDHCFYLKKVGSSSIILLLYVYDMLVAGLDIVDIKKLKRQLSQEFKMKDLGSAKQILCMSIIRDKTKDTLRLSREKYIGKVLEKFNMNDAEARCQPLVFHIKLNKKQAPKTEASLQRMAKVLYALAIGSVMYTMVCTRPDIAHAVGLGSRFMSNPEREHWEMVKWLLCYLKGSLEATLCFSRKEGGITVSWMSRIQKCVAMSTAKADYMAISAIYLAKNPVFYGRTKHIKIRYHYIREVMSEGTLAFKKIIGAKNPTNMITKVVTTKQLMFCAPSTGLRDN
ncbi:retrovirus-related pol polyprotein from transposon TNT 1-94 [Tanacetum coccineum]